MENVTTSSGATNVKNSKFSSFGITTSSEYLSDSYGMCSHCAISYHEERTYLVKVSFTQYYVKVVFRKPNVFFETLKLLQLLPASSLYILFLLYNTQSSIADKLHYIMCHLN